MKGKEHINGLRRHAMNALQPEMQAQPNNPRSSCPSESFSNIFTLPLLIVASSDKREMTFPFVLGTDLTTLVRPAYRDPARVARVARRILHQTEIDELSRASPELHKLLQTFKPRLMREHKEEAARGFGSHHAVSVRIERDAESATPVSWRLTRMIAGRWSAKEAARKAWGANYIGFKDVRVEFAEQWKEDPDKAGSRPVKIVCQPVEMSGSPDPAKAALQQEGQLSISHDADYVVATVIAEPLRKDLRRVFIDRRNR